MIGQLIPVLSCDWLSEDRPRRVPLGGEVGGGRHHPTRPQQGTEVRLKVFLITFNFFIFSVILESISRYTKLADWEYIGECSRTVNVPGN